MRKLMGALAAILVLILAEDLHAMPLGGAVGAVSTFSPVRKSRAGRPTALQLGIGSSAADTAAGATPVVATGFGRTPGIGAGRTERGSFLSPCICGSTTVPEYRSLQKSAAGRNNVGEYKGRYRNTTYRSVNPNLCWKSFHVTRNLSRYTARMTVQLNELWSHVAWRCARRRKHPPADRACEKRPPPMGGLTQWSVARWFGP